MKPPIRLIDTGVEPARRNVAMTAALAELHRSGGIPDTLRFYAYRRSVLIGRNQVLAKAADSCFCRQRKIEVARRMTGGGAVYMSPGVLAWDLLLGSRGAGGLDEAGARICTAVAAGLSRLGFAAHYRAPNEIESGGRKLAGAAGFFDGPTLVHQGAILIDPDRAEMAAALALPPSALRERTVTFRELNGVVPERATVVAALVAAIAEAFGRRVEQGEPGVAELNLAGQLYEDEVGTDAFVEGRDFAGAPEIAEARGEAA